MRTTIPSCATSVQPAWSFGSPSTSTRHMRQAPTGGAEPRLVAEDGDLDPGGGRGLDEPHPLRDLDLAVVDRDADRSSPPPWGVARGVAGRGRRPALASAILTPTSSGRVISAGPTWAAWTSVGATTPSSDDVPWNGQPPSSTCARNSSRNFAT